MTEYKESAMTDQLHQTAQPEESLPAGPPGPPGWVKALAVALVVLLAVFIGVMLLGGNGAGGHGPGRHTGAAPW